MITHCMLTDKGMRDHNEDMIGYKQIDQRYCFVVADGLGGHGKGEVASKTVVETILEEFETYEGMEEFLHRGITAAQATLLHLQKKMNCMTEMKTTIVCMVMEGTRMQWAFCGDSRLYYFQKNKIKQRTVDHSVPQRLALSKQIKEKEIRFHEDRNRLLRVLGMECEKQVYEVMPPRDIKGCQRILMCTDGFWEYIIEKDMEKTLKTSKSAEEWLLKMKKIVLENGKVQDMDNFSAITIWINN